ncbi:histidine kinase (plasmid) [Paenibacillus cellulosilyticus]|nr:sensor histidine kinase [Paenibacillus cellulosilyticus]QKS43291.1 histidine kinase [Paenibacillus cellulosilyticus]
MKKANLLPMQASLQTKVFLMFLILLLFVLCCFLAYVNWQVIRPLKETNENEKLLTAAKISRQLDQYINNQNQLSQRVLSNQQIHAALTAGYHSTDSAAGLSQNRILKEMMFEAIGPSVDIRDMIIYDLDGKAVASYIGYSTNPSLLEPSLKDKLDSNEYMLYRQPNGISAFDRAIINQNGQIYGYLSIQLDQSELQLSTEDIAVGDVYVLDSDRQIISSSPNAKGQSELSFLKKEDDDSSGMYLDGDSNYIAYDTSDNTGWTTYVVTPKKAVLGSVNSVQYLSILLITLLMLFSFVYIYFSTRNLLLPIRKLRSQISRISYSNLNVKVDNQSHNNELMALSESFQELLNRLQQSIESEKLALQEEMKARNSALQAQIAPHFIHNVLYLISIASQEGKNKAVSDMCKHLSDSLRYIVSSPYQHVSLAEELEHTRNYLSLVQQNYESDLEWEIIADDAANHIELPRLVIQPFVENCIEHAFDNTDPPWRIQIRVQLYNGIWAIEISDNGEGIAPDKINEIMDNISNSEAREHELHMPSSFGNMGVVNTVNRLKLMYKNRLFFNLYNNVGEEKGATVQIIASLTQDFEDRF